MRTNRLISRQEASALELQKRVELEARVTDALGTGIQIPVIPPDWTFRNYSHHRPWRKCMFEFLGPLEGKTILDLGCGYNPTPVYFALAGAQKVFAVDVSTRAIDFVTTLAQKLGFQNTIIPYCGPAAALPFEDESIDLIHGEAVLHHLDLNAAGKQLSRVLKSGGRAAFKDPLGHNWMLEFARDYLPYSWKHAVKGTDCPLRFADVKKFSQHFSRCEARGFGLSSMLAIVLMGRRNSSAQSFAHRIDEPILRLIPWLQRFCRFVVTCVEK